MLMKKWKYEDVIIAVLRLVLMANVRAQDHDSRQFPSLWWRLSIPEAVTVIECLRLWPWLSVPKADSDCQCLGTSVIVSAWGYVSHCQFLKLWQSVHGVTWVSARGYIVLSVPEVTTLLVSEVTTVIVSAFGHTSLSIAKVITLTVPEVMAVIVSAWGCDTVSARGYSSHCQCLRLRQIVSTGGYDSDCQCLRLRWWLSMLEVMIVNLKIWPEISCFPRWKSVIAHVKAWSYCSDCHEDSICNITSNSYFHIAVVHLLHRFQEHCVEVFRFVSSEKQLAACSSTISVSTIPLGMLLSNLSCWQEIRYM